MHPHHHQKYVWAKYDHSILCTLQDASCTTRDLAAAATAFRAACGRALLRTGDIIAFNAKFQHHGPPVRSALRDCPWHVAVANCGGHDSIAKPQCVARRITGKRPFKVRLLHMDPLAIFGKLYAEEKLQMHAYEVPSGAYKGRLAIQVRLKDKKPWYRRML